MNPFRARKIASTLLCVASCAVGHACGPFFPETVLDQPNAVLRPPFVNFAAEVRGVPPPSLPPPVAPVAKPLDSPDPAYRYVDDTLLEPELKEMAEILAARPSPPREGLLQDYTSLRRAMFAKFPPANFETSSGRLAPADYRILTDAELGKWPDGLPKDVILYLQGALQYQYGNPNGAIEIWKQLLALPAGERRNRSTWAAWMIARTLKETGGLAAAIPYYEQCMTLSSDGFSDPLQLGLSSLGWVARNELDQGHRRRALELYYHQAKAGDIRGWESLRRALPDVKTLSDSELREMAADPFQRGLITAELLENTFDWGRFSGDSGAAPGEEVVRWLTALEQAGAASLADAARWAELAYSDGQFDLSRRWLKRAAANDPRALWIRAKLALMDGRSADAERDLLTARAAFPREMGSGTPIYYELSASRMSAETIQNYRINQLYGDLGAAALAVRHYPEALTAFYQGSFDDDGAYLAERVLTREELAAFVRQHFPGPTGNIRSPEERNALISLDQQLRYLTARRMAREFDFKNAREFYPNELIPVFDRYVDGIYKGHDGIHFSKSERAASLWNSAQIHASLGMTLFGTEGEPDAVRYSGNFPGLPFIYRRLGLDFSAPSEVESQTRIVPLPAPSDDEIRRVNRSRLPIERRYQYKYAAANLAWKAAELMPNNSDKTAEVLGIAGSWVKYLDPPFADRFYKAMIWRNWNTPLAREADRRHWFPPIEWEYAPFVAVGLERPANW